MENNETSEQKTRKSIEINDEDFSAQRDDIINNIIIPKYKSEIKHATRAKYLWKKISNGIEALAQILLVVNAVMAFTAGFFKLSYLSYINGFLSILCLALFMFAVYAERESNERGTYLSNLLNRFNIRGSVTINSLESEMTES